MIQYYISDGARLRFFDAGVGQPVIFLHPTPLNHAYWLPVLARLRHHRAIAPDLRGHGDSELEGSLPEPALSHVDQALPQGGFLPGVSDLTLTRMADDQIALLDHLKIEKADFVGCSIGGYLLLELWRRIPDRINKLAFVCSKAQSDTPEGREKRKLTIQKFQSEGVESVLDSLVKSLTGLTSQIENPMLYAELRAMATLTAKTAVAVQAGLAQRPDSLTTVATIHRPVLAIAAEEDAVCTAAEMEAFKQAPGGCQFHLLSKTGHFAACEQPDRVASIIQAWLDQ